VFEVFQLHLDNLSHYLAWLMVASTFVYLNDWNFLSQNLLILQVLLGQSVNIPIFKTDLLFQEFNQLIQRPSFDSKQVWRWINYILWYQNQGFK
jgi:hypothetical protein